MNPHQLDIVLNGAFVYERRDGSRYASLDYKLKEYGIPCVGRMGPLLQADLNTPSAEYVARCNADLRALAEQVQL